MGTARAFGRHKIFCVGYNKTGTTSLKRALRQMGYCVGDQHIPERILYKYWPRRDFRSLKWFCYTAQAFQDFPFSYPDTFLFLDHAFPKSRFILTVRDSSEQWYESLVGFYSKLWGDGEHPLTKEELEAAGIWYIHSSHFGVTADAPFDREKLIAHYESHNATVQEYFRHRPEDLLVLNVADCNAYQDLCNFLNKPCPQEAFPWENKT